MNLTIVVFLFLLEEIKLTEKELNYYDQKLDSVIRQLICQGFFVKNFQDKVHWG